MPTITNGSAAEVSPSSILVHLILALFLVWPIISAGVQVQIGPGNVAIGEIEFTVTNDETSDIVYWVIQLQGSFDPTNPMPAGWDAQLFSNQTTDWTSPTSSFYTPGDLGIPGDFDDLIYGVTWADISGQASFPNPLPNHNSIGYLAFSFDVTGARSFNPAGGIKPDTSLGGFMTQFSGTIGSAFFAGLADGRTIIGTPTVIPIPAAVWLFGSGLGVIRWIRVRAT